MKKKYLALLLFILAFLGYSNPTAAQGTCDCCNQVLFDYPDSYEFLFPPDSVKSQKIQSVFFTYDEKGASKQLSEIYFNEQGYAEKVVQYEYLKYVSRTTIKRNENQKIASIRVENSDANEVFGSPESSTMYSTYSYKLNSYTVNDYFWTGQKNGTEQATVSLYNLDSKGRVIQYTCSTDDFNNYGEVNKLESKTVYSNKGDSIFTQSFYDGALTLSSTDIYNERKQFTGHLAEISKEDGMKRMKLSVIYCPDNTISEIISTTSDGIGFTECPHQNDYLVSFEYSEGRYKEINYSYDYLDQTNKLKQQKFSIHCAYNFR